MECLRIQPPIRGEWKAIHNPGDSPHALDFVGLRPERRLPYPPRSLLPHVFYRIPAEKAFGWNRPVYAPFDGEVIEARDGYADTADLNLIRDILRNIVLVPDLDNNVQRFAGNYVVIEGTEGVALLAHLRCDSVTVTSGDGVRTGEQIGQVGNSGASLLPHLHFQLLSEWPSDISEVAEKDRSFCFHQYDLRKNGAWETVQNRGPTSSDRIRITT